MPDERVWYIQKEFERENNTLAKIKEIFGKNPFTVNDLRSLHLETRGRSIQELVNELCDRGDLKPKNIKNRRFYLVTKLL